MVSMQIMAHPTSLFLKLKKINKKISSPLSSNKFFLTKCNGQRTFVARNQCNANEICTDNINFSAYFQILHCIYCIGFFKNVKYVSKNIKKLNYKQFSFLTLNNEDKSGKDPKRFPQHGKASLLCTNSLDYLF